MLSATGAASPVSAPKVGSSTPSMVVPHQPQYLNSSGTSAPHLTQFHIAAVTSGGSLRLCALLDGKIRLRQR